MKEDQQDPNDAFADSLSAIQPKAPNFTSGEVMFQAGVDHANRNFESIRRASRNKMRLWQLATAASLLIAASSSIAFLNTNTAPSSTSIAKSTVSAGKQHSKGKDLASKPQAGSANAGVGFEDVPSASKQPVSDWRRQQAIAFFGFVSDSQSTAAQRHRVLTDGVASLPEIQAPVVAATDGPSRRPVTTRTLLKQLTSLSL